MTTSLGWTPAQLATFDAITRIIGRRGGGVLTTQLRDAGALARELHAADTDLARAGELADALDLTTDDLDALPWAVG